MILGMADRPDDGNGEIPRVAKPSHDHREPEELRRRPADQRHYVPEEAPDGCADEHVERDEPPVQDVVDGNRLAEVDEDEAGEEEREDELAEELEGGPGHDLDPRVSQEQADDRQAQQLHQRHHGGHPVAVDGHLRVHGPEHCRRRR